MIPTEPPISTAMDLVCPNSVQQQHYRHRLHLWCAIRLLPNMQRAVILRTRQRNVAEDYLRVLKHLHPEFSYILVFDPMR